MKEIMEIYLKTLGFIALIASPLLIVSIPVVWVIVNCIDSAILELLLIMTFGIIMCPFYIFYLCWLINRYNF